MTQLKNQDILIRRQVASSRTAAVEFFTLHRHPSDEPLSGPFVSEEIAAHHARQLAKDDGCAIWIQSSVDPTEFEAVD